MGQSGADEKEREWYKHKGVAPGAWLGYGATTVSPLANASDQALM